MKKNGFTIIEIIVVVVLLTVIALITIPNISNVFKTSRADQLETVREEVSHATQVYLENSCGSSANKELKANEYVRIYLNNIIDCGLIDKQIYNIMNDEYFDINSEYVDVYIDEVGLLEYKLSF